MFEPTLEAAQVRHLPQVLALFYHEMAQHSADGITRASLRVLRMSSGNPLGANSTFQLETWKPGSNVSASVGTSGSCGSR